MYNKPMVLGGLTLFVGLVTFPFWYSQLGTTEEGHTHGGRPAGECVEATDWMRANHMLLLLQWRDEVVRDGERTYVNSAGKKFEKSLTNTCLGCHSNAITAGGTTAHQEPSDGATTPGHVDAPGSKPHGHGDAAAKTAPVAMMNAVSTAAGTVMEIGDKFSEAQFCAECHQSLHVKPYCWSCHLGPKE